MFLPPSSFLFIVFLYSWVFAFSRERSAGSLNINRLQSRRHARPLPQGQRWNLTGGAPEPAAPALPAAKLLMDGATAAALLPAPPTTHREEAGVTDGQRRRHSIPAALD